MIKKSLEYVCAGNNGRSPLAETIAKNYINLKYSKLANIIEISSSGTLVDAEFNFGNAKFLIARGYSNTPQLYSRDEIDIIENEILINDNPLEKYQKNGVFRNLVNSLAERTLTYFQTEEKRFRDKFLNSLSLKYESHPKQIEVDSDISLFLPVDAKNYRHIKNIYIQAKPTISSRIEILSDYAKTEPIPTPIGSPYEEEWIETFKIVKKAAENSIDRFIEEYIKNAN